MMAVDIFFDGYDQLFEILKDAAPDPPERDRECETMRPAASEN